nr:transposase [Bacteroidota bacterium]
MCADKVSDAIANERRRQLKKSSSGTPSNVLLQLLSWSIYFTSIDDDEITSEDIFSLYKLRWRIEIIFKSMKATLTSIIYTMFPENQLKFILKGK